MRYCLSCAGTCACWAVWLVLAALLAVQVYVIAAQELPVPGWMLRRVDARLEELGLAASFGRAQFDPSGKLLLEDVRLRSHRFEDPLLTAGTVYVRKSIWSVLSGDRAPDEIRLDAATLSLPAPLSPTGMPAPLLSDLAATLRLETTLVHVDQLSFRVGSLSVTARGQWQTPPRTDRQPPDVDAVIQRFLRQARTLARELGRLETVESPVLDLTLSVRPGIGNVAEFTATAAHWREQPQLALTTGPLLVRGLVRLDGTDPRPLRLWVTAHSLAYGPHAVARRLDGRVTVELSPARGASVDAIEAQFATPGVMTFDERVDVPVLDLAWQRGQPLRFSLSAQINGEAMSAHGRADPERGTLDADFSGRVAPSIVSSVLPARAPKFARYFHFGDPVDVHGRVAFAPGWKFDGLWTRVRAGRLNSSNVLITSARGRIDIDAAGNFLAHEAVVAAGENHARGSYWMNFRSLDFRILLTGALKPPHIAGWFRSDWWSDFWENFEFDVPPAADVDVTGNWRAPRRTYYFGRTDATAVRVMRADFEQAHARVFVRPHFAHAFDLQVARAGGEQRAEGWFKRFADPGTRVLSAFDYDLRGNLEPVTLRRLGGPLAATLLEPWVFGRPPHVAFRGRTTFANGEAVPDAVFEGQVAGGSSYEGFPLERLDLAGFARGDRVQLERMQFQVAGGQGSGHATLTGSGGHRRLDFDVRVADADMVRTLGALAEFDRVRQGRDAQTSPNRELLKRASGGKLQFRLAAAGNPADLATFDGAGEVHLTGAELGEIHLFGLLSQVLSGLALNFSSLKLDTLRSNFRLAHGNAHFPDLRVTGSTAVIEAKGDYRLTEQTLDFTARLKPYEENRNIFTAAIGIVINPLTSILELRLTGPIQKPVWSFSLGSSTPARDTTTPAPPAETSPPPRAPAEPPKSS